MKIHPDTDIFPLMPEEEFQDLKANIKANGLLQPIRIVDDQILDGRHRFRACQELGIKPKFEPFQENGVSTMDFVVSQNLHRRHLTCGQRNCVAWLVRQQVSKKMVANRKRHNHHTPKSELTGKRSSSKIVGKMMSVPPTKIEQVNAIHGRRPDLFKKVFEGSISMREAYNAVRQPKIKKINIEEITCPAKAILAIQTMQSEGWDFEIRFEKGFWRAHSFNNQTKPYSSWIAVRGFKIFHYAVRAAVNEALANTYQDA